MEDRGLLIIDSEGEGVVGEGVGGWDSDEHVARYDVLLGGGEWWMWEVGTLGLCGTAFFLPYRFHRRISSVGV